jgi:hypothetical protein
VSPVSFVAMRQARLRPRRRTRDCANGRSEPAFTRSAEFGIPVGCRTKFTLATFTARLPRWVRMRESNRWCRFAWPDGLATSSLARLLRPDLRMLFGVCELRLRVHFDSRHGAKTDSRARGSSVCGGANAVGRARGSVDPARFHGGSTSLCGYTCSPFGQPREPMAAELRSKPPTTAERHQRNQA